MLSKSAIMKYRCLKRSIIFPILIAGFLTWMAVIFALFWTIGNVKDCTSQKTTRDGDHKSAFGTYKYAAVASNHATCSKIGNDVLARQRGNAVDAAIATVLCSGVPQLHLSGIGGGSFFVIYDKKKGWFSVNSRETAPAAATSKMFLNKEDRMKATYGGLAIAVPGNVKGLVEIHRRFGTVLWKSLVSPTLQLLQQGFPLSPIVHRRLQKEITKLADKSGFEPFLDENQRPKPVGSIIRLPKLARTFEILADDPMSFYIGSLAEDIVKDIQERGGIHTLNDLKDYKVTWKNPTRLKLPGNKTLYSMPAPGSGAILSYILSILSGYNMNVDSVATDEANILTYHRIVEAMKFAYGKRSSLGDDDFVNINQLVQNLTSRSYGEQTRLRINDDKTRDLKYYDSAFYNVEDSGTAHASVIDGQGNAVSVTYTINTNFGSKVIGRRTGILFNNEMDDFSTPGLVNYFGVHPAQANFIQPSKRPLSSMSPAIVWDDKEGKVHMVTGTAGGTRITTTTAWLIMNVLWFNLSLPTAMDIPRIHHQLMPMNIVAENDLSPVIRAGLEAKGHTIKGVENRKGMSNSHSLHVTGDSIVAVCDYRTGAKPDGY